MAKKHLSEKSEMDFEQSLQKLEQIVGALENGETPLDETIQKFEEGMLLIQRCQAKLNEVEKKFQILVKDKNGNLSVSDAEMEGE